MSRKSTPFGKKTAAIIVKRVAAGEPLAQICKDSHIPSRRLVYKWLKDYPDFREQYEAARASVTSFISPAPRPLGAAATADKASPEETRGRPSLYSPELADSIIEMMLEDQSLRSVCGRVDMPTKATVYRWITAHEDFRAEYESARRFLADLAIDAIRDIADDQSITDKVSLGKAKLRIEARFKLAEKLYPKRFGNKITQELTGVDGGPVEVEDKTRPNDLEVARRVAFLLEKGMKDLKESR